ncbi:MAG: MOSC domain-containing protein, partial [Burkholderiales bacterium]|nr:MOSC domain-containing protein [Anaerolineae bacterium]
DEFRAVDMNFARSIAQVGFADGYPMLMISEASLVDLNEHLTARGKDTVPMTRFRPNIVIAGCEAFAEDDWQQVRVGDIPLDVVKGCARCVTTTVDQQTGTRPDVKEPLATLASYRTVAHGAIFGQNLIHRAMGTLRAGDTVNITETAVAAN